jgi:hypothetical protein
MSEHSGVSGVSGEADLEPHKETDASEHLSVSDEIDLEAQKYITKGTVINKEWSVQTFDLIKFVSPALLMLVSGILIIICGVPVKADDSYGILQLAKNAALLILATAAQANITRVSSIMLTRSLYEGFKAEYLKSATESSLLGTFSWLKSFLSFKTKHIGNKEKANYILIFSISLFFLIFTAIILAIADTAGEWNVGTQRLAHGKDVFTVYDAFTASRNDLFGIKTNNQAKFGTQDIDADILDPNDNTGVITERNQVWSGTISLIRSPDEIIIRNKIAGTGGTFYNSGIGVIGTVSCSKYDMDYPRSPTVEEAAQFNSNGTCLASYIERVASAEDTTTFDGWKMSDMHIPFNLFAFAPDANSKCKVFRITCGINVAKTNKNIQYRDGHLVNWSYQAINTSDNRDKEAAENVFQWLQGAMYLTSTQSTNENKLKLLRITTGWTIIESWTDAEKGGASGLLSEMLQKVLRACMMTAAYPSIIPVSLKINPLSDSWDKQKLVIDNWLSSHDLSTVKSVTVDVTQNSGRPYGLAGLVLGCTIALFGLVMIVFYSHWYINHNSVHRLLYDRLSNFTRLAEALGGPRVGQDRRDCVRRKPIKPNEALIRFGAVNNYVEISEEAAEIDPSLEFGS